MGVTVFVLLDERHCEGEAVLLAGAGAGVPDCEAPYDMLAVGVEAAVACAVPLDVGVGVPGGLAVAVGLPVAAPVTDGDPV